MIQSLGYPVEVHHVTSGDGYILELHRIPYGLSSRGNGDRPVALLHHGMHGSSADWILNTPDQALGECWDLIAFLLLFIEISYILADKAYDVWLANARGNRYSRAHRTLDPNDIKFWNFSWDEMADWDLPAMIDYILRTTGERALFYVGFSMGTTVLFAMLSEHPEYNDKIRAMAALAPVAYQGNARGLASFVAPFINEIDVSAGPLGLATLTGMGVGEAFPNSEPHRSLAAYFCDKHSPLQKICRKILSVIEGPSPGETNRDFLPKIVAHIPAGTSVHTVSHFGQLMTSGEAAMEPGMERNMSTMQRTPVTENRYHVVPRVIQYCLHNRNDTEPLDVEMAQMLHLSFARHGFLHREKVLLTDGFFKFDLGPAGNLKRYGQSQPPSYNLGRTLIPVAIFAGENDYLADPRDVELTERELPNVVQTTALASFSHVDFILAAHAYEYVYKNVLDFFSSYMEN
nr:lipase member K-like [Penaeus vannamei]